MFTDDQTTDRPVFLGVFHRHRTELVPSAITRKQSHESVTANGDGTSTQPISNSRSRRGRHHNGVHFVRLLLSFSSKTMGKAISVLLIVAMTWSTTVKSMRTRLTWVNGIGYNETHMVNDSKQISKMFGGTKCHYCMNPTAMTSEKDLMGYLNDLTQAGTQKLGWITMEVNALVKHLQDAVNYVGKNGRVVHIAHSQGALITFLAAKQLSANELSRIEVLAFGGAAALHRTAETPFCRCINYYSVNDPLLWIVPSAEQALRSGLVGDSEFCFLSPKVGDPIQDHHLLAPTYAQALSWEGQRYRNQCQSIVYRTTSSVFPTITLLLRFLFEIIKTVWKRIILAPALAYSRIVSGAPKNSAAIYMSQVWRILQTPRKSRRIKVDVAVDGNP